MSKNVRKSKTENSIANLPTLRSLKVRGVVTVIEGVEHVSIIKLAAYCGNDRVDQHTHQANEESRMRLSEMFK